MKSNSNIVRIKEWTSTTKEWTSTTLLPMPGVNVPGLIEHTALVYKTDPRFAFSTLVINWPDLTVMEAHRLMQGEYEIEYDDSVVITFV